MSYEMLSLCIRSKVTNFQLTNEHPTPQPSSVYITRSTLLINRLQREGLVLREQNRAPKMMLEARVWIYSSGVSEAGNVPTGIWATIYIIVLTYAAKPKLGVLWGRCPKIGNM